MHLSGFLYVVLSFEMEVSHATEAQKMRHNKARDDVTYVFSLIGVHALKGNPDTLTMSLVWAWSPGISQTGHLHYRRNHDHNDEWQMNNNEDDKSNPNSNKERGSKHSDLGQASIKGRAATVTTIDGRIDLDTQQFGRCLCVGGNLLSQNTDQANHCSMTSHPASIRDMTPLVTLMVSPPIGKPTHLGFIRIYRKILE